MLQSRTKPKPMLHRIAIQKTHTCPIAPSEVKVSKCPVTTCMYHSLRSEHHCMLEGQIGIPEAGDISEAVIRKHKGLTIEQFREEKTKALRYIKRGIIINRMCEWMDRQPDTWFQLRTGYSDPELQTHLSNLKRSWPWNIPTCNWTPGKMLMVLKEQSWEQFSEHQKLAVREPHLRILKTSLDEARKTIDLFGKAYQQAINAIGA